MALLGNPFRELHSARHQSCLLRKHQSQVQWLGKPAPVRVPCSLDVNFSKAVFRLKERDIEPSSKMLRQLRKKEAWKQRRRDRKEKAKADKMKHPVWYDWYEEENLDVERSQMHEKEEDDSRTDDFLCFIRDQRPPNRILVKGEVTSHAKTLAAAAKKTSPIRRIAPWNLKMARFVRIQHGTSKPVQAETFPDQNTHLAGQSLEGGPQSLPEERTIEPADPASNTAWTAAHTVQQHEFAQRTIPIECDSIQSMSTSPQLEQAQASALGSLSENVHKPSSVKQFGNAENSQISGIERFFDEHLPREPEVWIKGPGLVKRTKLPYSTEIKDFTLSRRKDEWENVYSDEIIVEEVNSDESMCTSFGFDGRSAIAEDRKIQRLAARLNETNYWTSKMHFGKVMHSGRIKLTDDRVLRIIKILGEWGNWRRAMQVVHWVHKRQRYQFQQSRYVFTTLLAILGKAHRPVEALKVFNVMRESFYSYPDMAAYHSVAVTLGQCGHLRDLLELIESLEIGPVKPFKCIPRIDWKLYLNPDIVIYNAVLNACIPTKQWAGIQWTWKRIERSNIKPNGATYGLTIEAMVKAGKFDEAVQYYKRMERAGFLPNAQTYKCLIEIFGKARRLNEATELFHNMQKLGIAATASVYYVLACSLCIAGRLQEALVQVSKLQELPSKKEDVITYTGLIQVCRRVGRIQDAIFLFEHMQKTCSPNVSTCNEMIKLYGRNHMFGEAKSIYEAVRRGWLGAHKCYKGKNRLIADSMTFDLMMKASAVSGEWDYLACVYNHMILHRYHLSAATSLWLMVKVADQGRIELVDDIMRRLRDKGETPDQRLYEAHILSCLCRDLIWKAVAYLNDMEKDGLDVQSAIKFIKVHAQEEAFDSFLQQADMLRS